MVFTSFLESTGNLGFTAANPIFPIHEQQNPKFIVMNIVYVPVYKTKAGGIRQSPLCYGSPEKADELAREVLKKEQDYTSYEIKELWLG